MTETASWEMWALPSESGELRYPGPKHYTRMYSSGTEPVPVMVREDPEGTYFGWLPIDADTPRLIYPRWNLFTICFPYGPEAEQDKGKGRILRLSLTPAE